jgi:hypothetical protein
VPAGVADSDGVMVDQRWHSKRGAVWVELCLMVVRLARDVRLGAQYDVQQVLLCPAWPADHVQYGAQKHLG